MNAKIRKHPGPAYVAALGERRRHRRLSVRLGVVVRLEASEGGPGALERTVTRNISPGDACFDSDLVGRLRAGDRLEVDIELPVEGATVFSERRLHAVGQVVRLEPLGRDGGPGGVAVVFEGPPVFHPADV